MPTRQEIITEELYPGRKFWDYKWRWYLRGGDTFIGPFKTMTEAWRHRRDFGPQDWKITQMPDHHFIGTMFPPTSAEEHRWEAIDG